MKKNKGLTLVALIITIVILMILAVVTIREINKNSIIENTKTAKAEYINAQFEEKVELLKNELKIRKSQENINIEEAKEVAKKYFIEKDLLEEYDSLYVISPIEEKVLIYGEECQDIIMTKEEADKVFTYSGSTITKLIDDTITDLKIPSKIEETNITNIGGMAFYCCTDLTTIQIPSSITNIGASAFYGCNKLTKVIIPNNITKIRAQVFAYCKSLEIITIPNSVISIFPNAFYGCNNITINIDKKEGEISGAPFGATNATINWLRE